MTDPSVSPLTDLFSLLMFGHAAWHVDLSFLTWDGTLDLCSRSRALNHWGRQERTPTDWIFSFVLAVLSPCCDSSLLHAGFL